MFILSSIVLQHYFASNHIKKSSHSFTFEINAYPISVWDFLLVHNDAFLQGSNV